MSGAPVTSAAEGRPRGRGSVVAMVSSGQIRSFSMVGILLAVWIVFQFLTSGLFLTPRNLTNLSGQVAITAILAAGVVLVMVPGYIDLSIGATVSFCAVIAALASSEFGLSTVPTIVVTLAVGLLIGAWHALWVAWFRVPPFIVTLASLLAVRGLSLVVTGSETPSPRPNLLVVSNATLPASLTALLIALLAGALAVLQWREYSAQRAAGIAEASPRQLVLPILFTIVLAGAATAVADTYRGLPLPVAILLAVMVLTGGLLRLSTFGRRLYAIGGNREAAELAGIHVMRNTALVFLGMGVLYGVAGLLMVARLASAPPDAGNGLELDVIAAAVIGGTSLLGGRGTVAGAVIGAVLMESLSNGMSLMNLPSAYQSIAVGLVLLLAVYADLRGRGSGVPAR